MIGTTLGIGSSQLGQPNPWGLSTYGGQPIGTHPFTQQPQSYGQQPLQQLVPFAGSGIGNYVPGVQTAQYAQPLPQIQQLMHTLPLQVQQLQQLQQLQQQQHILQQQQLHQLQQLLQLVPQQLHQLQQLIQLLPQQLQQIQQLVQFVPQQIYQLQQQLWAQQAPFGSATPGLTGVTMSQPFGVPFGATLPFGILPGTGQVM